MEDTRKKETRLKVTENQATPKGDIGGQHISNIPFLIDLGANAND